MGLTVFFPIIWGRSIPQEGDIHPLAERLKEKPLSVGDFEHYKPGRLGFDSALRRCGNEEGTVAWES
jgi:hypothetical protein